MTPWRQLSTIPGLLAASILVRGDQPRETTPTTDPRSPIESLPVSTRAVVRAADRLNRLGVEDALAKAGARPGDEVVVGDVSFDFEPGILSGPEHRIGPRGTDARLDGR